MARRRKASRVVYRRAKSKRRKSSSGVGNKVLIGLALTSTVEPLLNNVVSQVGINISDDILKLGAGYFLAKKQGYMKGIGYGLFARGAGNVVGNLLNNVNLGGLLGGAQPAASANNDGW